MTGCLHLTADVPRADRPAPFDDDVSFSESFVAAMLARYTQAGDIVIDPFAGFGTTLAVAERMGRVAYGIELMADRATYIRDRVQHPDRVITGDASLVSTLGLPAANFSLSSPPYMTRWDHPQNPLTGYSTLDGDYDAYIDQLTDIYTSLAATMRDGARIAVNVANIRAPAGTTFLAWDLGRALAARLELQEELTLCWDRQDTSISQDYCFVLATS